MTEFKESKILDLLSRPLVTVPFLLFLVALSYGNTLYSPFVLDDMHSFIEDPKVYVRDFSYDSLGTISKTTFGMERFIPMVTFAVNHYFSKGQMPIYHITNILIHLLSTLVLYWMVRTLLKTPIGSSALRGISAIYFALFAAALWALNPVQTNAVTYVVQRMTSIAALFYLATVTLYVKGRLARLHRQGLFYYALAAVMALCAFLSKENSYMLPFAIFLVEWMFITPDILERVLRKLKWHHWLVILLLALILLPLMEPRWMGLLSTYSKMRPFTMEERVLTEARVVIYYISLLLLPLTSRLTFDYDFPVSASFFSPVTTFLSLFLLVLISFWSYKKRKQHPLIIFGVVWYFMNLMIESSVVPLELVFEHRLYLPSVGIFIACLGWMDMFVAEMKKRFSPIEVEQLFVLTVVFVMSLFSISTTLRNNHWRDSYTLYTDNVQKSPNKPRVLLNLGVAMGRDRDLEMESIAISEKAIALGKHKKEEYFNAANNIIVALLNNGQTEEAIARGEKYLQEPPSYTGYEGYAKFLYNLTYAFYDTEQYSRAMQLLATGLTLDALIREKGKIDIHLVKLMVKVFSAAYDDEEYRAKLELTDEDGDKSMSVRLRMARLLYDLKDYEKARGFLKPVLENHPDHELAVELNGKIEKDVQKNRKQGMLTDIRNHPPYKNNLPYKIYLDLVEFIFQYYSPLNPAVGWLLNKAEGVSSPGDPFVLWYRLRWYKKLDDVD
ncbi:tetratricopeptide repeat protein, partial [Thermodesulfobacteriota bacterium]